MIDVETTRDDLDQGASLNQHKNIAHGISAPEALCGCHIWHPTHATVTIDGKDFLWKARSHRKMRYLESADGAAADLHPSKLFPHLFCWEPKIVTWHICWIGVVANTLWVVNGLYATWPEQASSASRAEMISYVTGVIGGFMFIVTGYLGFVEAINQTHTHLQVPTKEETIERRQFIRPNINYGHWWNPIAPHHYQESKINQIRLLREGYALVQDVETKKLVTAQLLEGFLDTNATETEKTLVGRQLDIRIGGNVVRVAANTWRKLDPSEEDCLLIDDGEKKFSVHDLVEPHPKSQGYRWWTWQPDLHYIGIFSSIIYFISTVIFFLPATLWYPMAEKEASLQSTIFWVYVLQIIPSLGFIFVGYTAMAEASGSWLKADFNSIGWWIALCNTIGGLGFLLFAVLALPVTVDPGCCHALTKWGADFATFWGSCYFWVAGVLQCIEFSSLHPIKFM